MRFTVYDETSYKPSDIPQASPAGAPGFWSYSQGGQTTPDSMLSAPYIYPPNAALPKPPIVNATKADNMTDGMRKACCSAQSAKEDVQRLIADFKYDLDNILVTNFTSKPQSPLLPSPSPALSSTGHNVSGLGLSSNMPLCSVCALSKRKLWIICDYCKVVEVCHSPCWFND